ncbi:MAG: hypothetical protein M3253_03135 [Chloroflexota bacterium]|nr:hypothetical protein [Chloroflexota bacterium]
MPVIRLRALLLFAAAACASPVGPASPIQPTPAGTGAATGSLATAPATSDAPTLQPEQTTLSPSESLTSPITAVIPVGEGPILLAATGDAIWVENHRDSDLSRIDPATNREVANLDDVHVHCDIEAGSGSVWGTFYVGGTITEVDAASNEILRSIKLKNACGLELDGHDLWVSSDALPGVLRYRLDQLPLPPPDRLTGPAGDPTVGFDSLWINGEGGMVLRLDPDTGETQAEIRIGDLADTGPLIAHGSVWAWSRNQGVLHRIDPATNEIVKSVNVEGQIGGVGAGTEQLWVSSLGGKLVAIDPATLEVTHTAELGRAMYGAPLEAFGSVWISALDDNVVMRVDPSLMR